MKIFHTVIIILFMALIPNSGNAEGEFEFGDEDQSEIENNTEKKEAGTGIPLRGKFSIESARQIKDPSRWIRIGPALHLIFDYNTYPGLFYLEATGRYNDSYRLEEDSDYIQDHYDKEVVLRELYWKRSFGAVTASIGNIMIVWGKADILPVTDVVSAVDRSESFFANPEESRLGQNTIKLEYFGDNSETSIMFIPYPRFDRFTDRDHPYSYIPGTSIKKKEEKRKYEAGLRHNIRFGKGSLSLLAGWFNNREPILSYKITNTGDIQFYKEYEPSWFAGNSINIAVDPFLIKFEAAYYHNKPQQKIQTITELPDGTIYRKKANAMAGFDYNGGNIGNFILESSISIPVEKHNELAQNKNILLGSMGWSNTFFSDNLKINAYCIVFEKISNILFRLQAEYYFTDVISVYMQYTGIVINSNEEDYEQYDDYDRGDIALRYDFDMM